MNLDELTASQLRALRPQLGDAGRDRVDTLLRAKGEIVPVEASLDVTARRQLRNAGVNVKKSEEQIRREIRGWLELNGAFVWDMEQNRPTRQTAGMSDLVVCWPSRGIFFIEVKSATGKQREGQLRFQKAVECSGGTYVLARSIEDVAAITGSAIGDADDGRALQRKVSGR